MKFQTHTASLLCTFVATSAGLARPQLLNDVSFDWRADTVILTQTLTETKTVTESAISPSTQSDPISSATPVADIHANTRLSTRRATSDDAITKTGSCYTIPNVGTFTTKKVYEFDSDSLPSDLQISSYLVYERKTGNPWNHGFLESNVNVRDGFLNLIVPGRQVPASDSRKAIYGGEVYTAEQNILYASVRTGVIFDDEPGTCQGIFSYNSDTAEIDIEYLSNTSSTANPSPDRAPVLWYTNQPGGTTTSQRTGPAPADAASSIHEYRIDWTPSGTKFYVDGTLQRTLMADVPSVGSQWVWNNWANGNADWSTGPPLNDNVFRIDSITMYYNTTSGGLC